MRFTHTTWYTFSRSWQRSISAAGRTCRRPADEPGLRVEQREGSNGAPLRSGWMREKIEHSRGERRETAVGRGLLCRPQTVESEAMTKRSGQLLSEEHLAHGRRPAAEQRPETFERLTLHNAMLVIAVGAKERHDARDDRPPL